MQYYECPICGAHLDPGEKCDCDEEEIISNGIADVEKNKISDFLRFEKNGQMKMIFKEAI